MISVWKGYAVRSRQGVGGVFEDGEQDLVFGTDRALNRARDFRYTDSAAITSWDFGRPEAQKDGLGPSGGGADEPSGLVPPEEIASRALKTAGLCT